VKEAVVSGILKIDDGGRKKPGMELLINREVLTDQFTV
jgi:hypothetical protein